MTRLTQITKEALLKGINKIPIHIIKKKIDEGELTLEECIEYELEESKVEEIRTLKIEKEIKEIKDQEDQALYDQIKNDEKPIDEIQNALMTGKVTEEGLLNHTTINKELIKKIREYSRTPHSPKNNSEPLGPGTDIFFFGRSGSGKTCVLASVFNYAEEQGLFIDNPTSIKGINYKNLLINELNNGVLPYATPANKDNVTYISTTLIEQDAEGNNTGKVSPLNFVEMSGEFFQKAAQNPEDTKDTIDAHGYLSGPNKKLLFFIVDYQMYSEGKNRAAQSQDFQLVLNNLDKYKKSLKNTLSIYIIVTKADKFPEDVIDKDKFANEFFRKDFKSVYTNLKSKRDKHGFELVSLPFSIGSFMFDNSYLHGINQEWPDKLVKSIGKHSSFKKKNRWGIFSSTE